MKEPTLNCTHGVALALDADHSCFECEKEAVANGLPIEARIVTAETVMASRIADAANMRAKAPGVDAPAVARDMWAGAQARVTARALGALRGTLTDINGDPLPTPTTTEADGLRAQLKALETAFIGVRAELAEMTADRDAFARENFEYVRTQDSLRGMYERASMRLRQEQVDHTMTRRDLTALRTTVQHVTEALRGIVNRSTSKG